MTPILRYRVNWTGFSGAPGVSTFYLNAAASFPDPAIGAHAFFNALTSALPNTVQIAFPNVTDTLNAEDGKLISSGTSAGAAGVNGSGGSNYAAPAGVVADWLTGDIVNGHRVKGRTFIIPAVGYPSAGGTPDPSVMTALTNAQTALMTAYGSAFIIWARPFAGRPAVGTKPALPARVGSMHVVTAATSKREFFVLRSRRD